MKLPGLFPWIPSDIRDPKSKLIKSTVSLSAIELARFFECAPINFDLEVACTEESKDDALILSDGHAPAAYQPIGRKDILFLFVNKKGEIDVDSTKDLDQLLKHEIIHGLHFRNNPSFRGLSALYHLKRRDVEAITKRFSATELEQLVNVPLDLIHTVQKYTLVGEIPSQLFDTLHKELCPIFYLLLHRNSLEKDIETYREFITFKAKESPKGKAKDLSNILNAAYQNSYDVIFSYGLLPFLAANNSPNIKVSSQPLKVDPNGTLFEFSRNKSRPNVFVEIRYSMAPREEIIERIKEVFYMDVNDSFDLVNQWNNDLIAKIIERI